MASGRGWLTLIKEKNTRKGGPPGPAPCVDAPGMSDTCAADRGHCLQYTVEGNRMDKDCAGTCGSCDSCRCQDSSRWYQYCPGWTQYCEDGGALGNWMSTYCRKSCGRCGCKCCSYNGKQYALGDVIMLPEKCGQLKCIEGLVAPTSSPLAGASSYPISHPEELTLTFIALHSGSDCCMLPGGNSTNNMIGRKDSDMVPEGWTGNVRRDSNGDMVPAICCHGTMSVPLSHLDASTTPGMSPPIVEFPPGPGPNP